MSEFDWLRATNDQRKELYKVVKRLVDEGYLIWNDFFSHALGRSPGADYTHNFAKGLNSRKDCVLIARFLNERYPEAAQRVDRQVNPDWTHKTWDSFYLANRTPGEIGIVLAETGKSPD